MRQRMMRQRIGFPVLALLLVASNALAQNGPSQTANHPLKEELPERVATARCAYAQTDALCAGIDAPGQNASTPADRDTLAQLPGRMPSPPTQLHEPPMGSPYRGTWAGAPDGRHVLIGAAIGFAFGAAAGAKNGGVRGSLAVGALVGLLGAGIGAGIPSFPHPNRYRRGWDDEEEASNHKPRHKAQPKPQTDSAARTALARSDPPELPTVP